MYLIEYLFHFGPRESMRSNIPHHEVVVSASRDEDFAFLGQRSAKSLGIQNHLLRVIPELLRLHFLHLHCYSCYVRVVRPSLILRKNSKVNRLFKLLPIEDDSGPGSPETLVRSARDHIAVLEGRPEQTRSDQTARVGHVGHQQRT